MESASEGLRERRSQALAQKVSGMMKDCTFRPNGERSAHRRNASQFITDQRNLHVLSKINLLKMVEEAHKREIGNCKEKPSISQNSKDLLGKRHSTEVCKRLYPKDAAKASPAKAPLPHPVKSKELTASESKVVNRLYRDAKCKEERCKKGGMEVKKEWKCASDEYVISKFMKELASCIAGLGVDVVESPFVSFEVMKRLFVGMGFAHSNPANDKELDQIFAKIFDMLIDSQQNLVHIDKLKVFIAAILNIQLDDSPELKIAKEFKQLSLLRKMNARKDCTETKKVEPKKSPNKKPHKPRSIKAGTKHSKAEASISSPEVCAEQNSPCKPKYIKKCSLTQKKAPYIFNEDDVSAEYSPVIEKAIEGQKNRNSVQKQEENKEKVQRILEQRGSEDPVLKIKVDIDGKAEIIPVFKDDTIDLLVKSLTEKHSSLQYNKRIDLSNRNADVLRGAVERKVDKMSK
eukprot:TRINITY_DN4811_c0_g2_i11.p1 TRINITY_DN4811_c0_g2~~TRINITY_DN4811_c0_g2_i11.p1  ORF type:complete len:461 (+),score=114.01 TRINITY_DN4811_c0_g2_i11:536-1918(+)